ncbi:MAG: Fis family transcriptional regulator [Betaproteobacteria bacterium]|jgi:Fis family transcriptional regulator|nr:Fis family transcriptional regulator [Pseudomonadota bacterium]NBO04616.1 Fis family transcriptional regulator [Betaproteobacteria bacterium]NBO94673.1 Fis family transcriptional regulator [Betaproteobacteria bacterium]NBP34814.1 Fis family transcriptional regulator [Betaproteobacteria bacterium]NBP37871.1 Fis family transcriptional regulator [Betaproteobacteria bacterium]
MNQAKSNPMALAVEQSLERYFADLEGARPAGIYDMVILTVEKPMLVRVMLEAGGNQLRAAQMLGINRNTLRKKLQQHGLLHKPLAP